MVDTSSYSPLMPGQEEKKHHGALTAVIIVIVIILIGAIFAASEQADETTLTPADQAFSLDEEIRATSTALEDIDRDLVELEGSLNDTELDQLDQDVNSL